PRPRGPSSAARLRAGAACSRRASTGRRPRRAPRASAGRRRGARARSARSPSRDTLARSPPGLHRTRSRARLRRDRTGSPGAMPLARYRAERSASRGSPSGARGDPEIGRRRPEASIAEALVPGDDLLPARARREEAPALAVEAAQEAVEKAAEACRVVGPGANAEEPHDRERVEPHLLLVVSGHVPGERVRRVRCRRVALPVGEVREALPVDDLLEREIERTADVAADIAGRDTRAVAWRKLSGAVRPPERRVARGGDRVDEVHLANEPGTRREALGPAAAREGDRLLVGRPDELLGVPSLLGVDAVGRHRLVEE